MPPDDLARLRHLAAAGDAAAAAALEREARRRGDTATARLAKASQESGDVQWAVLADRLNALSDPDPEVRALAVDEVSALDLPMRAVGKALLDALRADPAPAVRAAAAAALSGISADADEAALIEAALIEAALEAALQDPSPWVRDQAAASLLMRPEPQRERWQSARWERLRTQLYAAICHASGVKVLHSPLEMDVSPIGEPMSRRFYPEPPAPLDEENPLHWAFMIANMLRGEESYRWMGEARRATIARLAPLTALAVVTELCCSPWKVDSMWPDTDGHGPLLARCVGIGSPSEAMIAQLDAQLRSDAAGARHAAAIGCSALLTGMHSHALRALTARWAAHDDPLVRACLLPGRLLIAADPERKRAIFEEAMGDPSPYVRTHALALLTGHWEGPWAPALIPKGGKKRQNAVRTLQRRAQLPPRAFDPIWTRNAVEINGAFSLYVQATSDVEAEVRAQAFVGLVRVHEGSPALASACAAPLLMSAQQDPDLQLRSFAQALMRYLISLDDTKQGRGEVAAPDADQAAPDRGDARGARTDRQ